MPGIDHVAIWTTDLERSRSFYESWFGGTAGELYHNPKKDFKSYFIRFESGARLELMFNPDIAKIRTSQKSGEIGYAHIAISVGSEENVERLTEELRLNGYEIAGEPRRTGDGYYESVVLDPDGNRVEITV